MNTEQLSYAQRFAVALFRSGMLSGANFGDNPERMMDAAAEVIESCGLGDADILGWLRDKAIESGLPEAEICAKAWHLASGRAEDFAVLCKNYGAPFTKTVAEGVAPVPSWRISSLWGIR